MVRDAVETRRVALRSLVLVRWFGVAFGIVQVSAYSAAAYPPGAKRIAYGLVGAMALVNVLTAWRLRSTRGLSLDRLALVGLVADVLVASGVVWVYAFDNASAIFVILVLLPIEGALHFGLRGATYTWGAVSVLYLGREWLGTTYGYSWDWTSVSFRTGVLGIVALIVGRLVRDLHDQRAVTVAALHEARRADEWRSRLVSILAHDVRAPLAAVRSGLGLLETRADMLSPEQRRDIQAAALRQTDRALLLARDLLDMARSEAGALEVLPDEVDVNALLRDVAALSGIADALQVEVPAGLHVYADRGRLEQVLHNLLHNAERYGAAPYEVSARAVRGGVEIRVRDHGPGVPDGVDLFSAFAGQGAGSVGLGMWTARALTEAHGGRIHYEHASPGAAFVLWFPDGTGQVDAGASSTVPDVRRVHADAGGQAR